ncbi:zinc finger miz domain-containing protein [Holotrichia oblita]|uniref:Zinc finger miz domain-containing protein n=1 Tax=Holotrichia oblita TaxID=644536 RepID=A0ACB9TLV1_HOLOL|nr:zinc finger miz domain-containing protein [Holotrichia oblita]
MQEEMSENLDELRSMLVTFRVSELQMLLGFAGRNKSGRKNELQQRALELLRVRSHPIQQKIRDLYKAIQQSGALNSTVIPQSSPGHKELPPTSLNTNMSQTQGGIPRATATVHPYNMDTRLTNPVPTNKPGVEPKRPPRPVNITPLIKLSPTCANTIHVSWGSDYVRGYAITVALVHKRNSQDLLQRLKNKGVKHSDYTRGLIKEKLNEDADCEIATTSLRVSLMCPLGKMKMTTPSRAITCQHLQCFDAHLFLQMNERKPTWSCPVCDKPALYDNLVIDGYFQEVLNSNDLSSDTTEIQLNKDGSWSTHTVEKKSPPPVAKVEKTADDSIEIISDDVVVALGQSATSTTDKENSTEECSKKEKSVVDLTISDSDDDEPLAKRRATNPKPDSTIKFSGEFYKTLI